MGEVELFNYLTVCKQMIIIKEQCLKPFNCVQTIKSNTWNHLILIWWIKVVIVTSWIMSSQGQNAKISFDCMSKK